MNITSAKYLLNPFINTTDRIKIICNGVTMDVPMVEGNSHFDEIMRQVEAGDLTIADAD